MFSELFLAGYPPEDLVLKPAFVEACHAACEDIAADTADGGPAILVGLPWAENGHRYNAYALLEKGRIEAIRFKVDLPNYGVFDEKRVFSPGPMPGPVVFKGVRIGIPICEDIWGPDPVECIAETGGEILLVPNGSPYWRGKTDERLSVAVSRVVESKLPLIYLNQYRRPGRTRLRRRLVRPQCRFDARIPASGFFTDGRKDGLGAPRPWLCLRRGTPLAHRGGR